MKTQARLTTITAALLLTLAGLALVLFGGAMSGSAAVDVGQIDAHREGGRVELVDPTAPPAENVATATAVSLCAPGFKLVDSTCVPTVMAVALATQMTDG